MKRRAGFTLLEILLAMLIGMLLIAITVPSITGMMREEKLKKVFLEFDTFVQQAQLKAVKDRKTYVLIWEEHGVHFQTLDPMKDDKAPSGDETGELADLSGFSFADKTTWVLERPAALVKNPVWEWPFWRTGLCESVRVRYEGPEGMWVADYNGLTARGKLTEMITR